ncbi:MAG: hypothetical protein AAFN12_13130, partial [Cyanobacteria bacterium J06560_2]
LLREKLQPHLGWHGARTWFVAAFIIALFRSRTVNLSDLSVAFLGLAKPASHYNVSSASLGGVRRQGRSLTTDREFIGGDWLSYLLLAPDAKLKNPF